MLSRILLLTAALGLGGTAVWANSPDLRARLSAFWDGQVGWTEKARQADPAGFVSYAQRQMKADLAALERTRRELSAEVGRLAKPDREQSALAQHARTLAEQFRDEYQQAEQYGGFPIEVQGAAYAEPQVRAQVSMLLAEAEGYEAGLADIESVRQAAETKIEQLAVQISRTETQLAVLATKRELLQARQLTTAGEQLLAQVDELMTGNRQCVAENPVGTVRELLARAPSKSAAARVPDRKVDEFLTAKPAKTEVVDSDVVDSEVETGSQQTAATIAPQTRRGVQAEGRSQTAVGGKDKPPVEKKRRQQRGKPIFQQS